MLGPDLNDLCDGEGVDGLEALLLGLNSKLGALLEKKLKTTFFFNYAFGRIFMAFHSYAATWTFSTSHAVSFVLPQEKVVHQ